jgi:hypothetical protein
MVTSPAVGPIEGTAWQPGRSGNTVSWDGSAVVLAGHIPAMGLDDALAIGR